MSKVFLRNIQLLSVVFILSLPTVLPIFQNGFFPMHDDTQPSRVFEMAQALGDGQFPVRMVQDLGYGYGYPIFNFYAPLPYYIGGVFNLLGMDVLLATKIMIAIGVLLSGSTMYLLARKIYGKSSGALAAILYMYAPYHALLVYVRGAVGELYGYAFLPLVFYGMHEVFINRKMIKQAVVMGSLGIAGVFMSHNILGVVVLALLIASMIVFVVCVFVRKMHKAQCVAFLTMIVFGFGLSAFFTIPAFSEKSYTRVDTLTTGGSDYRSHFLYPDQLWDSPWGFAGSAPGREDGMSFKIGKIHIIFGILGLLLYLFQFLSYKSEARNPKHETNSKSQKKKIRNVLNLKLSNFGFVSNFDIRISSFIVGAVLIILVWSVFMMLEISRPVWMSIPLFSYIQYPWRFLTLTLLCLSLLGSAIVAFPSGITRIIVCVFAAGIVIAVNGKYFTPQFMYPVDISKYTGKHELRTTISAISDEYLPPDFVKSVSNPQVPEFSPFETSVDIRETFRDTATAKSYLVKIHRSTPLVARIAYFPGWRVLVDGKETDVTSDNGRISSRVSTGTHRIDYEFFDTPVRVLSNTISLFSLILLGYVSLPGRKLPWVKDIRLTS